MRLKPFTFLFLVFALTGCESGSGEDRENTPAEKAAQRPVEPASGDAAKTDTVQKKYYYLNNENAEEFLREYAERIRSRNIALTTRYGTLKIRLFEDTPLHTANFLMMIERNYFTGTEFTRIVEDFVVQGGNSERESDEIKRLVIGNYLIPSEINDRHIHRKGALAMARRYENNPEKKSSAYDFYLVAGRTFNDAQLTALENQHEMTIPEWRRKVYRTAGGAPHLDGQHTVFGVVTEGFEVLDRMAKTPTDESDWPLESLVMEMTVLDE